jgi:predicted RecA/RadA family phage recombinase
LNQLEKAFLVIERGEIKMAAGDVIYEYGFFLLPTSKNATANIAKGDVVSLKDGRKCMAGDDGPFGVAITDIANGEDMKGKVLIKGIVKVVASGSIGQFTYVAPDDNGKVKAAAALSVSVPIGDTPVTSNAAQPNLVETGSYCPDGLVGTALEAASANGDVITIILQ